METTRSYLFVTFEGGGNVPPVLGLARRLSERGHTVTVLTEPCLEPAVREAGAEFIPFTRHFTRTDRTQDIIGDWKGRTPIGALQRTMENVILGPIQIVAVESQRAIAETNPDVVVADVMMPGALIAAEAAGIPRVVLFHMPEYLPGPGRPAAGPGFMPREDLFGRLRDGAMVGIFYRVLARYQQIVNETRRAFGLTPFARPKDILEMFHTADRRLIQTTEAFDFPIRPAPPNVRYVGPVLDDPDWIGAWTDPWPADDARPLVVVSLSSTFQNQHGLLQRIVTALGEVDVRGLVTLGPAMAGVRLELPSNVRIVDSAPHAQIFPEAAAVITHAGHGTVMRALAAGVPVLCIPMGRDQDDNAARVAACGAGLRLPPGARPSKIGDSLRRVLGDSKFRTHAQRMQRLIEQDVAEDLAVAELEGIGSRMPTSALAA